MGRSPSVESCGRMLPPGNMAIRLNPAADLLTRRNLLRHKALWRHRNIHVGRFSSSFGATFAPSVQTISYPTPGETTLPFSRRRNPNMTSARGTRRLSGRRLHNEKLPADNLLRPLPLERTAAPHDYRPMHARELIELAALVSAHGPVLVQSDQRDSSRRHRTVLDEFQSPLGPLDAESEDFRGNRLRRPAWGTKMARISRRVGGNPHRRDSHAGMGDRALRLRPNPRNRRRGARGPERDDRPSEARHRVLTLLSASRASRPKPRQPQPPPPMPKLDRPAGRPAGRHSGRSEFAVDPKRAKDFAEDAPSRRGFEASRLAWPLLLASLRTAFQRELGP